MRNKTIALISMAAVFSLSACIPVGGKDHYDFTKEQVIENLQNLEKTGFNIEFKAITEDDTVNGIIGAKDTFYWLRSDDEGVAVQQKEKEFELYKYNPEFQLFLYEKSVEDDTKFEEYLDEIFAWLAYALDYDGQVKKVGPVTFIGRECTEYKYENVLSNFTTAKLEMTFYIDNDYGITLKADVDATDDSGKSSDVDFEATSFVFGDDVVMPEFA